MRAIYKGIVIAIGYVVATAAQADVAPAHHELTVELLPASHEIRATDALTVPPTANGSFEFYLHSGLTIDSDTAGATITPLAEVVPDQPTYVRRYRATLAPNAQSVRLHYRGRIEHALTDINHDVGAQQQETPGTIGDDSAFLAGSTFWYPYIDEQRVTFDLRVTLPPTWNAVSQGESVAAATTADRVEAHWRENAPQEEIYLIAAPLHEYRDVTAKPAVYAFLRDDDAALAKRYLDATRGYIRMYETLIGPYPYGKFAVVENDWETGYGMPSFTLLGPKVIRLPFILHTSYPHEILHNWWGNGVYVDVGGGNWSEGLTSYLADQLLQEQRGAGAEFRRGVLQNYSDFVRDGNDFALRDFRSRHSSSSEAVGYGKAQMLFHMLRNELGDDGFRAGLRKLYTDYRFRAASFGDVERSFSAAGKRDMKPFFAQWVERIGAPQLSLDDVTIRDEGKGSRVHGVLRQVQAGPPYRMSVNIDVATCDGAEPLRQAVKVEHKDTSFEFTTASPAARLCVDPQFDVFRRLDRRETPPALSQAFGAERAVLIVPSQAPAALRQAYQELANAWAASDGVSWDVRSDADVTALPADQTVWVLGLENRYASHVLDLFDAADVRSDADSVTVAGQRYGSTASMALVARARDGVTARALLFAAEPAAVAALAGKLPHYRKYSYVVFDGANATNVAKGQWSVRESPLMRSFKQDGACVPRASSTPHAPLVAAPTLGGGQ